MYNNPLIPGDPYMYDVKWIIAKLKELITGLENFDIPSDADITNIVNSILANKEAAVVNVKDYGAKGDGVTDDHESIISAISAAESINSWLYFPAGSYLISAGITIPHALNILMDGTIFYNGTGAAVTIGEYGTSYNYAIQNWKISGLSAINSGSVGLEVKNANSCLIYLNNISRFETGVKLNGDGAGLQNNTFVLGTISNFTNGLLLYSENGGWSNENVFIKGRFYNPAHAWTSKAIVIDSAIPGRTSNNNIFHEPNLEGNDYGVYLSHADYNKFYNCRMEAVITPIHIADDLTQNNEIEIGYGSNNLSTARNIIIPSRTPFKLMKGANYNIHINDIASNAACNSSIGCLKDLYKQTGSGPAPKSGDLIFTQTDDFIVLPGARTLGAYIELYNPNSETGFICWNIKTGSGNTPIPLITFYDETGTPITTPASDIRFTEKSFSITTSYGHSSYIASSASPIGYIAIPAEAKAAFVGFATGGPTPVKGIDILSTMPIMLKTHNTFLNAIPTSTGIAEGQICFDTNGGFWIWNGATWAHS